MDTSKNGVKSWARSYRAMIEAQPPQPCCYRALPGKYFSAYTRIIISTLSFRVDFNPMKYSQVTIWGKIIVDVILVIK